MICLEQDCILSFINEFDMTDNTIMDSSKRQRLETMDKDRISELPDCLILHIFKFIPLTDIVQTCVLSKRWETLWTDIQFLDFCNLGDNINFEHFVNSVLLLRNLLDVNTFCLQLPLNFDQNQANVWIDYAIDHNVRVFEYKLPERPSTVQTLEEFLWFAHEYKLPQRLFTCQSLEELRVVGCGQVFYFSELTSLERLKKLHLYQLEFSDEDLRNMISGCPLIETLHMEMCSVSYDTESEVDVDICSQTMKHLIIERGEMTTLRFCIPNLLCLHYETKCLDGTCFVDMPCLENATISGEIGSFDALDEIDVPTLIRPFANARSLKLCGPWIESISKEEVMRFPAFVNLKRLIVSKRCMHDFEAICCLLRCAPNVDCLAFIRPDSDDGHCSCGRHESDGTPCLKFMEFRFPWRKL